MARYRLSETGRLAGRAAAVVLGLTTLACGPMGPFSGGRLSGEEASWPTDWSKLADVEQAQLETNPDAPHSINIWFVIVDNGPYLATSLLRGSEVPKEREWVQNVAASPRVRLRVEGKVYPGQLEVVADSAIKSRAFSAFQEKYPQLLPEREAAAIFYRVASGD